MLLEHPAVSHAVTFAVPDARVGEEIVAAVVLASDRSVGERELQDFAVRKLAPFKVPRRVVFVDEIPKGPTGKVQRLAMAELLDLSIPEAARRERAGSARVSPRERARPVLGRCAGPSAVRCGRGQ